MIRYGNISCKIHATKNHSRVSSKYVAAVLFSWILELGASSWGVIAQPMVLKLNKPAHHDTDNSAIMWSCQLLFPPPQSSSEFLVQNIQVNDLYVENIHCCCCVLQLERDPSTRNHHHHHRALDEFWKKRPRHTKKSLFSLQALLFILGLTSQKSGDTKVQKILDETPVFSCFVYWARGVEKRTQSIVFGQLKK